MAARYLTYGGYTFTSGEAHVATLGSAQTKESFILSSDRIVYTWGADGYRAIRLEFKGSFAYAADGALSSGKVTDLTTALKYLGSAEGNSEQITSYIISSTYSDIANFAYFNANAPVLDANGIASGVNFFYKSDATNSNVAPNPQYFPAAYWSSDRSVVDGGVFPLDWWSSPFSTATSGTTSSLTGTAKAADLLVFANAPSFGKENADTITNFNPKEKDKLQIQLSQFGADAAGTFKIAKNPKALTKALATSTDFIYLKSRGELYYNENGKQPGFGDGGIFAILEGKPNINSTNIGFI